MLNCVFGVNLQYTLITLWGHIEQEHWKLLITSNWSTSIRRFENLYWIICGNFILFNLSTSFTVLPKKKLLGQKKGKRWEKETTAKKPKKLKTVENTISRQTMAKGT